MAQASTSTCKAAEKYTPSIATIEYSNTSTSEQLILETRHHTQVEDDDGIFSCFGWLRPFTSFLSDAAPEKQSDHSDRSDRLNWKFAGSNKPGVVNSRTNELDQNTHLHTGASCEESFSGSCPDRANIYKCPRIAADEKADRYTKNTRHDSSIDLDAEKLSLRLREIAEKTARAWDTYEKGELHPEQILVEDTKPAIQALETRRTATTVEDLKLVTSRYPLFPNPGNGVVESKCELGQTFDSMDGYILVTTTKKIFVDIAEPRNTLVAAPSSDRLSSTRLAFCQPQNL